MTRSVLLLAVWTLALGALSADDAKKNNELKAYRAARIVPVDGPEVAPGILLVRGDRVEAVLADGEAPKDAELVDLGDVVMLPGMVNPLSSISESTYGRVTSGRASYRARSPQDGRKNIALSRVNPKDTVYRRLGRTGYTTIALLPGDSGMLVGGQASVIRPTTGGEKAGTEIALREKAFLMLGYATGGSWNSAAVKVLKGTVDKILKARADKKKAEEEAKKKAAEAKKKAEEAKKQPKPPTPPSPPARRTGPPSRSGAPSGAKPAPPKKPAPPDALQLVFEGKFPAVVRVSSPADMDHFFAFIDALPMKFNFVLVTGAQPPEIVEKLTKRRKQIRGVILEPVLGSLWETSIFVNTARLFIESGFDVAFVPANDNLDGFRKVFFDLAGMVKTGLREKEALRAVTTMPARMLGLDKDVGALKKGAYADFQVFDSDPMSGSARLTAVYVRGTRVFADDTKTGELSGEAVR